MKKSNVRTWRRALCGVLLAVSLSGMLAACPLITHHGIDGYNPQTKTCYNSDGQPYSC